jgi:hypothetical protein
MVVQTPTPPGASEPEIDAGVIDDARARQRHHRRIGAALLAAAAIVGILVLGIAGWGGGGAGAGRDPHGLIPPGGEYYYLDELEVQKGSTGSFATNVRWWAANNGSGRFVESMRVNGSRSSFTKTFGAGGYDSVAYANRRSQLIGHRALFEIGSMVPLLMPFDPERLPVNPVALGDALRADVAKAARLERHGIYAERSVSEGTKELLLVANALQDPMDPPELRTALFTVALKLPGIAVQHGATDPLGRSGEAITASEGVAVEADGILNASAQETFGVIFNPKTKQILAETQYPSDHPAQAKDFYTVFTGQVAVATDTTMPTTG